MTNKNSTIETQRRDIAKYIWNKTDDCSDKLKFIESIEENNNSYSDLVIFNFNMKDYSKDNKNNYYKTAFNLIKKLLQDILIEYDCKFNFKIKNVYEYYYYFYKSCESDNEIKKMKKIIDENVRLSLDNQIYGDLFNYLDDGFIRRNNTDFSYEIGLRGYTLDLPFIVIMNLINIRGDDLFKFNVRNGINNKRFVKSLEEYFAFEFNAVDGLETKLNSKDMFWYKHNGITLYVSNSEKNSTKFNWDNVNIINGAQTTSAMSNIIRKFIKEIMVTLNKILLLIPNQNDSTNYSDKLENIFCDFFIENNRFHVLNMRYNDDKLKNDYSEMMYKLKNEFKVINKFLKLNMNNLDAVVNGITFVNLKEKIQSIINEKIEYKDKEVNIYNVIIEIFDLLLDICFKFLFNIKIRSTFILLNGDNKTDNQGKSHTSNNINSTSNSSNNFDLVINSITCALNSQLPIKAWVTSTKKLVSIVNDNFADSGILSISKDGDPNSGDLNILQFIKLGLCVDDENPKPGTARNLKTSYLESSEYKNKVENFDKSIYEKERKEKIEEKLLDIKYLSFIINEKLKFLKKEYKDSDKYDVTRYSDLYFAAYLSQYKNLFLETGDNFNSIFEDDDLLKNIYDKFLYQFMDTDSEEYINKLSSASTYKNDDLFKHLSENYSEKINNDNSIEYQISSYLNKDKMNLKDNNDIRKAVEKAIIKYNISKQKRIFILRYDNKIKKYTMKEHISLANDSFREILDAAIEKTKIEFSNSIFLKQLTSKFMAIIVMENCQNDIPFEVKIVEDFSFIDKQDDNYKLVYGEAKSVFSETMNACETCEVTDFPPSKKFKYFHVRPHAKNSSDTYSFRNGDEFTKRSFWIDKSYVAEIITKRYTN